MEMVKLFQLQLEHYEKVEGTPLSLEGKANQLSMMIRGNLPAAMQGMPRADVAPGQKHGAVLLVAGRVEDVAEIDRFAQAFLDPPDKSLVCLLAAGHR